MKHLKLMLAALCCSFLFLTSQAQSGPDDGTYFIVNVATGKALTPVDGGVNSNTRLKKFNKSGMQKWKIKKYVSKGKNGKEIVSYTIQNAASGFYLRPYFVPDKHEAIVSEKDGNSSFSIVPDGDNYLLKSNKMGGDALYSKGVSTGDDEPWFGTDTEDDEYGWQLILVE